MQYPDWIWHNGAIKPWAEATTHVMSHALHYGSSVFEGVRSYDAPGGPAIFRLTDHTRRLFASARIYEMALPYTLDEINAACREVLRRNALGKAYLRPVAYRGLGGFGLSAETPVDVAVAAWPMGAYLGAGVLEAGIDACVSSWQRFAPNTLPAGAKAGGNYLSGQLVAREARRLGFGEGIALASTSWSATCRASTSTCATSCSCAERPPRSRRSARSTGGPSAAASRDRSPGGCRTCSSACSTAPRRIGTAGWSRSTPDRQPPLAENVSVASTPRSAPGTTRTCQP